MQQYGYSGSPMMTGATNPEIVRRQVSQDLGYYGHSPMQQFSNNTAQGTFSQFGTNPQVVRQPIAQDLGYTQAGYQRSYTGYNTQPQQVQGYQPIQNQQYYNPSAFQQVMSASPDESQWVRQQIQQDIQSGSQMPSHIQGQGYQSMNGGSMLSQFGTNPQMVQNHIQSDLQNAPYQSSGYTNEQQYGTSTFAQFGTNPQMVQSHIQSDLNPYSSGQSFGRQAGTGMLSQFGTNPQMVQSHFQSDLNQYGSGQSFGRQAGTGMLSQFGTNPQMVRQHIQSDLGQQGGYYY